MSGFDCIDPGSLRHQILIQSRDNARNAMGAMSGTQAWSTDHTVMASIRMLSGKELVRADQTQSFGAHEVTLRYVSGVTSEHRILFGTRAFGIESVNNVSELDHKLVIKCTEQTTGA